MNFHLVLIIFASKKENNVMGGLVRIFFTAMCILIAEYINPYKCVMFFFCIFLYEYIILYEFGF